MSAPGDNGQQPAVTDDDHPVVPKVLRSVLYVAGTFSTAFAAAAVGDVPDLAIRLTAGLGAAALAIASAYRPTRSAQ